MFKEERGAEEIHQIFFDFNARGRLLRRFRLDIYRFWRNPTRKRVAHYDSAIACLNFLCQYFTHENWPGLRNLLTLYLILEMAMPDIPSLVSQDEQL